jgi:hypothetical protein
MVFVACQCVTPRCNLYQCVVSTSYMRCGTAPRIHLRLPYKARPHRIELHIADRCQEITFIHHKRGKSSLPQVTAPAFPEIHVPGVSPVRLAKGSPQPPFGVRHCNQVYMIGHKTVRPHLYATPRTPLSHQAEISSVILLSEKCRLPAIPSLRDVVRKTGSYYSCDPCHAAKLRSASLKSRNKYDVPINTRNPHWNLQPW